LLARRWASSARRFESCCLRFAVPRNHPAARGRVPGRHLLVCCHHRQQMLAAASEAALVPVWSSGKTRDCYSRGAGSSPAAGAFRAPRARTGYDAGLSTRKLRVRFPPGFHIWSWGSLATPPVLGTGDRRFDSCRPDLRGRGAAVLASLMSLRSWVRIPPALPGA
jgi:hypothetical protein